MSALESPLNDPEHLVFVSLELHMTCFGWGFLYLQTLQSKLEDDVNQEHYTLPCAFVIFRSLRAAMTALQVEWDNSPLHIEKMQAPEVSNVIWSNLGIGLWRRYFFGICYS